MKADPSHPTLLERIGSMREATGLTIRALRQQRMSALLPLVVVLLLVAYAGTALALLAPVAWLPRAATVVPFVYPLF